MNPRRLGPRKRVTGGPRAAAIAAGGSFDGPQTSLPPDGRPPPRRRLSQRRFRPRRRVLCRRKQGASPSNCKIPSGVQLPAAAALRRSHTPAEGHRHFRAIHALVGHTVNLRSAHLAPIIRTSEHFHVFSPPPRLSVRMFGCARPHATF
jgi:hypothetical protein